MGKNGLKWAIKYSFDGRSFISDHKTAYKYKETFHFEYYDINLVFFILYNFSCYSNLP